MHRWRGAALAAAILHASVARPADAPWYHDVEKYSLLRDTRLDVAGPEPASFTALGVAPFLTAQALASSDLAFSAAQILDDQGHPRAALGVDLTPWALAHRSDLSLRDYHREHAGRLVSRIQLSLAISKGESGDNPSMQVAPAIRIVLHEERDPRVHRGPGSLQDCFLRRATAPEAERQALSELTERLAQAEKAAQDPSGDEPARAEAAARHEALQVEWQAAETRYRTALQVSVREGMAVCRDDAELAAYTWNSTGVMLGFSPALRSHGGDLDALDPEGYATWISAAYGFDHDGTLRSYVPSFLGSHAQILGQLMYRHDELLPDPGRTKTLANADQYAASVRLRGGTSAFSGDLEGALLRDRFEGGARDAYCKATVGVDVHVYAATWMSLSVGRTFRRELVPDDTSVRVSLKWSVID